MADPTKARLTEWQTDAVMRALEASQVAPVSQYPGVADVIERLHEAAHRDSAVTISVRAQDLRNVLSALASSSVAPVSQKEAEPVGWRLVPVEPTDAMLKAGRGSAVPSTQSISAIYRAMLAVSPSAKEQNDVRP